MGRSVLADENLQPYLHSLVKEDACIVGLILGQVTDLKDYVIHFAKTPAVQTIEKSKNPSKGTKLIKSIADVSESWIADHAKHVTRMLPGGMYILGVFIVCAEDVLSPFHAKLRPILCQMHKNLSNNQYLFGNPESPDKLVVSYNSITNEVACKSYNVITSSVKQADFKFQPKAMKWSQLECKYNLDETFPIFQGRIDWPLKKHLQVILESINDTFKNAVFLFDNEIKDGEETLETLGKKKKILKAKNITKTKSESKSIPVSIFIPCSNKDPEEDLQLKPSGGFVRIMGQISSKLWLNPRMTIRDASQAVVQDIVRSLAARLEMHSDSLVDEESGSSEDMNSLHEPPRRVLIALPQNKVMLSDYLFPGEGADEALISVQELLDIDLQDKNNIIDVEGQPDLAELYPAQDNISIESEDNSKIKLSEDSNKFMYVVGFVVALLVLLISLILHFIKGN